MTSAACTDSVQDFGRCPMRYQDHSQNGETETCCAPAVGPHGYCEAHRKSLLEHSKRKLAEHEREVDYFTRQIAKLEVQACAPCLLRERHGGR